MENDIAVVGLGEDTVTATISEVSAAPLFEEDEEEISEAVSSEDCIDFVDEEKEKQSVADSARELLLSMLSNKDVLKDAIKMMDKEETKKRNTQKSTARQWRECTVLTTCSHCGVTHERTVVLQTKAESFVYIGENDKVHVVTFHTIETPCTFIAKTKFCGSCYDFIGIMSRNELEARYISLLKEIKI